MFIYIKIALLFICVTSIAYYIIFIYIKYFDIKKIKARKKIKQFVDLNKSNASFENIAIKQSEINSIFTEWFRRLDNQASRKLELLIIQSELKMTIDKFFILSGGLFFLGISFFTVYIGSFIFSLLPSFFLLSGPYIYLQYKANQRNKKFALQFPEAVDFMARSLKSGQAITATFDMIAKDFSEPLGSDFKKVFDEINYGLPFNQALANLSTRNSNEDLSFFVVSLIIQRESGGNLIELLGNLSILIRERTKMYGKIENLSAEGRMSGMILVLMPFVLVGGISIVNHQYISVLWEADLGKKMLAVSSIMMILGIIWIKKLVSIKV